MLTVASWNMNQNPAAWSHLQVLVERHGIDVFLLQEAGRPREAPEGFDVVPNRVHQRWKILPHRRYCSAIASVRGRATLTPRPAVPLSEAKVDWGEFVASHPGQFAAADVTTPGGDAITVVSLYGIWDKIPETGQLFADATLHRAISDLAVLFNQRGADKVLVAGDLNVWHAYEGAGERWAQRFHTVFDRLAAHGLPLLVPFRSDDRPSLEGCACGSVACRHVDTFRYQRNPAATPYQNDFMFATKQLQGALADNGCFACVDDDVWAYSDHRPVIARFALTR